MLSLRTLFEREQADAVELALADPLRPGEALLREGRCHGLDRFGKGRCHCAPCLNASRRMPSNLRLQIRSGPVKRSCVSVAAMGSTDSGKDVVIAHLV